MAKSMIACMATFTLFAVCLPFLVCSQAPGLAQVQQLFLPLNPGYSRIFGISEHLATLFAVPTTLLSALSFFFIACKQLSAMGQSGYLPLLGGHGRRSYVSEVTYVFVAILSFVINCISLVPGGLGTYFLHDFSNLALLGGFCVYLWTFVGYALYRKRYCRTDGGFKAPMGLVSAGLGFAIFALALVSLVALFDGGNYRLAVYYVVYMIIVSSAYFLYSSKHLTFSQNEQKAMFGAYVVKGILSLYFYLCLCLCLSLSLSVCHVFF
jgi:hypothetical protein